MLIAKAAAEGKDFKHEGECPVSNAENEARTKKQNEAKPAPRRLSLDSWAVILGLVLAALVRLGVLKHVAW